MEKNIMGKVYKIFLERTGLDFQNNEKLREKKLFGAEINTNPRDLFLVYMDLQKTFGIKFCEKDLTNKQFTTFISIVKLVKKACEYSTKEEKLCQN